RSHWTLLKQTVGRRSSSVSIGRILKRKDGGFLAENRATWLSQAQLDPIQKLFLHSIREYSSKSAASGGLVDAGPAYEKNLAEELTKLQRLYGGGDLTAFPEFKFPEPKLEEVAPK
uniref:ATP synthase peripheral stalk subunit F6, mitochondrial n=1 Tax=Oncorhynchus tshawytscha TaxID=74940 RepID=A0A8C8LSX6_ONCTS